jgi:hypothetical protein
VFIRHVILEEHSGITHYFYRHYTHMHYCTLLKTPIMIQTHVDRSKGTTRSSTPTPPSLRGKRTRYRLGDILKSKWATGFHPSPFLHFYIDNWHKSCGATCYPWQYSDWVFTDYITNRIRWRSINITGFSAHLKKIFAIFHEANRILLTPFIHVYKIVFIIQKIQCLKYFIFCFIIRYNSVHS